jgi:hypothetical protein
MDQDLASRMQEIMMRDMECEDGAKFDREHPTRRRAGSRLGRAICAYHAVLINMGGTLSDLMQTDLGGLDLAVQAASPERMAAFELTQELTEDYAPLMNLELDRVRALAAYLFAITVGVTMGGQTLGTNNKIQASLIQTGVATAKPTQTTASPSSSSSSGCPDPTATPVSSPKRVNGDFVLTPALAPLRTRRRQQLQGDPAKSKGRRTQVRRGKH